MRATQIPGPRPGLFFGVPRFFLQPPPTNSLVRPFDLANDRQLYLACWGIFVALFFSFDHFSKPLMATVIAVLALASISRQLDYASEIRLWESSVRLAPWNARAHNNLGYAYQVDGRIA